ncbi:hypothetical protein ACP70R_047929 [Stipagrostis hirtigluma subsp. patula]
MPKVKGKVPKGVDSITIRGHGTELVVEPTQQQSHAADPEAVVEPSPVPDPVGCSTTPNEPPNSEAACAPRSPSHERIAVRKVSLSKMKRTREDAASDDDFMSTSIVKPLKRTKQAGPRRSPRGHPTVANVDSKVKATKLSAKSDATKKPSAVHPVAKPEKKVGYTTCRCAPTEFQKLLEGMPPALEERLHALGFEDFLKFKLEELVDRQLICFLMDRIDHENMVIDLDGDLDPPFHDPKLDRETLRPVKQLLGLDNKQDISRAQMHGLALKRNVDEMSVRDFFACVFNELLFPNSKIFIQGKNILWSSDVERIGRINWCKVLLEDLRDKVRLWLENTKKHAKSESFAPCPQGCVVFLLIFYLDNLICKDMITHSNLPRAAFFDKDLITRIANAEKIIMKDGTVTYGRLQMRNIRSTCYWRDDGTGPSVPAAVCATTSRADPILAKASHVKSPRKKSACVEPTHPNPLKKVHSTRDQGFPQLRPLLAKCFEYAGPEVHMEADAALAEYDRVVLQAQQDVVSKIRKIATSHQRKQQAQQRGSKEPSARVSGGTAAPMCTSPSDDENEEQAEHGARSSDPVAPSTMLPKTDAAPRDATLSEEQAAHVLGPSDPVAPSTVLPETDAARCSATLDEDRTANASIESPGPITGDVPTEYVNKSCKVLNISPEGKRLSTPELVDYIDDLYKRHEAKVNDDKCSEMNKELETNTDELDVPHQAEDIATEISKEGDQENDRDAQMANDIQQRTANDEQPAPQNAENTRVDKAEKDSEQGKITVESLFMNSKHDANAKERMEDIQQEDDHRPAAILEIENVEKEVEIDQGPTITQLSAPQNVDVVTTNVKEMSIDDTSQPSLGGIDARTFNFDQWSDVTKVIRDLESDDTLKNLHEEAEREKDASTQEVIPKPRHGITKAQLIERRYGTRAAKIFEKQKKKDVQKQDVLKTYKRKRAMKKVRARYVKKVDKLGEALNKSPPKNLGQRTRTVPDRFSPISPFKFWKKWRSEPPLENAERLFYAIYDIDKFESCTFLSLRDDCYVLNGKDIIASFAQNHQCDDNVIVFFTSCLLDDERLLRLESVGYRIILHTRLSELLLCEDYYESSSFNINHVLEFLKQRYTPDQFTNAKHIFFPVHHGSHWTLYVVNFSHQQIDILDSNSWASDRERDAYHGQICERIRDRLYHVLHLFTAGKIADFSDYGWPYVKVELQIPGSNDCAFFVMIFLEFYDADSRKVRYAIQPVDSTDYRYKLLHYMMFHSVNDAKRPFPDVIEELGSTFVPFPPLDDDAHDVDVSRLD